MDLNALTDAELDDLRIEVLTEQERRGTLAQAPTQAEALATAYATAIGRKDGDPWTQPTGAHDAVPLDRTVTLDGKTWRSLHPANVWRPDPSSRYWEVVSGEPSPEPWSAGTYYRINHKVTYNGQTWNCTHEHLGQVGWEPGAAGMHAVWKLI